MIHEVEEEVLRFIGAILVAIITVLTRKKFQTSPLWHWSINMAFWQCLIPALAMEFQEPNNEAIGPIEMSFAIGIGVTLSTLFGIRTVVNSLPTEDFIAMIKSMDDAPKILIRRKLNEKNETAADVLVADDEPVVWVRSTDDYKTPIIEEMREDALIPVKPILKNSGTREINNTTKSPNKSPSRKLRFFNKKVKI